MKLDIKAAEMMKGTDKNSNYMVIGTRSGLKLGIRGLIFPNYGPQDVNLLQKYGMQVYAERGWVVVGFRMRVVAYEKDVYLENVDIDSVFGFKGFRRKGEHASVVAGIPLLPMPVDGKTLVAEMANKMVVHQLVNAVFETLHSADVELKTTPDHLVEMLTAQYQKELPAYETPDAEDDDGEGSDDEDEET